MDPDRLDRIVAEHVRTCERIRGDAESSDIRLIKPLTGVKSIVRIAMAGDRPLCALRVYPLMKRRGARQRMLAEEIMRAHELPAPRILDCRPGGLLRGPAILAEEHIHGRHMGKADWTPESAAALAGALARFHAVSGRRHGLIARLSAGSFFAAQRRKVRHRLGGIRRRCSDPAIRRSAQEADRWFARWRGVFAPLESFDLIHDKLNPGNVAWERDRARFVLLDFETLQFGCRVKDLVQACHDVLFDETATGAFMAAYGERVDARTRAFVDLVWPFYHAYHHLSESATQLKRSRRRGRAELPSGFHSNWAEAERLIASTPAGPG